MEKYESNQQQIRRPASEIYAVLSDFTNFTPLVKDKVQDWQANENSCSFKVQGITMKLMIIDKEPYSFIKFTGEDGSPLDFTFWIQLKEIGPYDTRMRLVLHADLNMMMKMMIGSKLKEGINQMAEQIANAFNGIPPAGFDPSKFSPENFSMDDFLAEAGIPGQPHVETITAEELPDDVADELDGQPIIFPDPNKPVS